MEWGDSLWVLILFVLQRGESSKILQIPQNSLHIPIPLFNLSLRGIRLPISSHPPNSHGTGKD